jgi:hypothetical protein
MLGRWINRDPHHGRIEAAIEQAAFAAGEVAVANLDLSHQKIPSGSILIAKMAHKNQFVLKSLERLRTEELNESKTEELKEKVETEKTLLFYLYEKALMDPTVDPEELASFEFLGMEDDIDPESIVKEREGWNSLPFFRYVPPTLVDIDYNPEVNPE